MKFSAATLTLSSRFAARRALARNTRSLNRALASAPTPAGRDEILAIMRRL